MTADQPSAGRRGNRAGKERRQAILDFHRSFVERHGYCPSIREVADAVGLKSTSAVSRHFTILEKEGCLTRGARMPRTVVEKLPGHRVVQERWDEAGEAPADFGSQDTVGVPMFERMAAGDPVVASPESVGTMWLPREMVGSGAFFAVKVVGDSMVNANIFDGDWVVVRQQDAARNGDIVAALIDEEATVKTFHFVSGHVWLMPQSPSYQPILGDHCRVMGKVVTTVRRPCTDTQITSETGPGG